MLENIRENSSGIVAWGIAILIIIAMAFFGVSSYVSHQPYAIIAEIGDRSINEEHFRGEFQNWQRMTRQRMGENAQISLDSDFFKLQTLDRMINQQLIAEISEKDDYRVGDKQVADVVRNNSEFQTEGVFDSEKYTAIANSYGSKQAYEANIRQNLSDRQVLSGLFDSSFVLPSKLDELIKLRTEKREFDLVRFPTSEYAKKVEVSDEEIATDYDANIQRYQQDEKVAVEYIHFKASDLEDQIELSEEDLQLAYEQNKEDVLSEVTREIRHVLLSGNDAEAQANAVVERLNQGEPFTDVAKEVSQDPGSAANGGSLGTVERGQMVKPFEDAAFDLDVNVVSAPVKSQFGYHVIEVTAINAPESKSFEEARPDLEKSELQRRAEDLFFEQIDQLKNLVYENPDSLQAAADELSLEIAKTELFSRSTGKGIAVNQLVRNAAFEEDVLYNNLNSEVIELSPTEYVAVRKDQHVESKPTPLEEVKQKIKDKLSVEKAIGVVADAADETLKMVKETSNWGDVLEKLSLTSELQAFSYVDESNALPTELLNAVFSISLNGKFGSAIDTEGNAFVFQLKDIIAATEESKTDEIKNSSKEVFQSRDGSLMQRFLQDKREAIGVKINQELL